MNDSHDIPGWLRWALLLVILVVVIFTVLIWAGIFDPSYNSKSLWSMNLESISLDAGSELLSWTGEQAPDDSFSLRLLANLAEGEDDIGFGLAVGSPNEYLIAAVSPLGYVSIWQAENGSTGDWKIEDIIPWRTWPHVHLGSDTNEIWIDKTDGMVSVWINRELLWQGKDAIIGNQTGIWAESFGEHAVVNFESLTLNTE